MGVYEGTRRGGYSRNAAENPIADKEYDNDSIVEFAAKNGMNVVIPPRRNAKISRIYDKELYKKRHIVENFFLKISVDQKYLILPSLPHNRIHHTLPQPPLTTAPS